MSKSHAASSKPDSDRQHRPHDRAAELLLVGLPSKTFVGLDLLSFNSSPNFHGITEVPAGVHFIYTGTDASLSIRQGRWTSIDKAFASHILRWEPRDEALVYVDGESPSEAIARPPQPAGLITYAAVESATANLQAEAADEADNNESAVGHADWQRLTSYISMDTVSRISPSHTLSSISSSPVDVETIPGLTYSEAISALPANSNLTFLPINLKQTWAPDDIGIVRTDRARDRSWYLTHIMDTMSGNRDAPDRDHGARQILAELQFTFLMVLTLANYSCLEQWKRLLTVLLTCKTALSETPAYFVEVLRVLALQMLHAEDVEGGLFELREEGGSAWLRSLVRKFRTAVEDAIEDKSNALHQELQKFEKTMNDTYGWELGRDWARRGMVQLEDGEMVEMTMDDGSEDETGDWAPTIVED